jgi:arsenate reductase (thioredoxin)
MAALRVNLQPKEVDMSDAPYHVLFISQRNSARSIMAEAILNQIGKGEFVAHSAGVRPAAEVDPVVIELLERAKVSTEGLRPQHVREFAAEGAPEMDFVFTLSDTAAGEVLPEWRGQPITAHWRSDDPEHVTGPTEHRLKLIRIRSELERRLRVFINLPLASLDRLSAKNRVDDIGRTVEPSPEDHSEDGRDLSTLSQPPAAGMRDGATRAAHPAPHRER